MEDLSLHILDMVENSLNAGATNIWIRIILGPDDLLTLEIEDNGTGMENELDFKMKNPFFTTKKTGRFGLGIPLLAQAARETGGDLIINSTPGMGTKVTAKFHTRHIDMKPLGDISGTLSVLQAANPGVRIHFDTWDQTDS